MKKIIASSLLVCVAVLAVGLWFLLSTSLGLRLVAGTVPGLTFESLEGRLMDSIHVKNLQYKNQDVDLTIRKAGMEWKPLELFAGLVNITGFEAGGCKIVYKTAKAANGPVSLPRIRLPLNLALHNARVADLSITGDDPHAVSQKVEKVSLALGISGSELRIDRFEVHRGQTVLNLAGTVTMRGDYPLHLITGLDYSIKGHPSVTCSGSIEGTLGKFIINQKFSSPAEGTVHAVIENVLNEPRWDGVLTAKNLFLKELPGVTIPLTVNARLTSRGKLDSFDLAGNLEGSGFGHEKASGVFAVSRRGKTWRIAKAVLSVPGTPKPSVVEVSGNVDEKLNLTWTVDSGNLSALISGLHGSALVRGSLNGPLSTPKLTAVSSGTGLEFGEYKAASIQADAKLDFAAANASSLSVAAKDVKIGNKRIGSFELRGTGTMADHRLLAELAVDKGQSASLSLAGGYRNGRWQGMLKGAEISSDLVSHWVLAKEASLSLSRTGVATEPICLKNQQSRLCALVSAQPEKNVHIELTAAAIPLSLFKPALPANVDLGGTFGGRAVADVHGKVLSADMAFAASKGQLRVPVTEKISKTFAFKTISMKGHLAENTLRSDFTVKLTDTNFIKGDVTLPSLSPADFSFQTQKISGALQAKARDIAFIEPFLPGVVNLQGTLETDLSFGGTLGKPIVTGSASLADVSAGILAAGIQIEKGNLNIEAQGTTLKATGSAASGKGRMTLDGKIDLAAVDKSVDIHIKGKNFQVAGIPEVHAVASPNIDIMVRGERIDVHGNVLIPEAEFKPPDHEGGVRPSDDVVIVGQKKEENKRMIKVFSDLRVRFGDSVYFDGFGLKGKINGDVRVTDMPGKPTTGSGKFRITKGQYKLYKVVLTIEDGRLYFAGSPLTNPLLDIHAFRKIGDVTAGAAVGGTLDKPKVTLYSTPEMEDSEILSYLILGSPLNSASQAQGGVVYNAAKSLSLTGGEFIAQKIGGLFGLKDISIQKGTEPNQESLVIGRYLSPRIYISYGIGIFDPVSTIKLKYTLTKKIILQMESGVEGGADILYTFEKK